MADNAPRLYGPDGKPVALLKRDMVRRLAAPVPTGFRRAQQWQSVVQTLDPGRLRAIYWALAAGTWCPDFFELAEEIEERDLHYRGVLQQRRLRAASAAIDVVAASEEQADEDLADEVRERVLQGPGWHGMLLDLLDAVGKGVSCTEIIWRQHGGRWEPAAYYRIDPRWLVWDDVDGTTPLLIRERRDDPMGGMRPAAGPMARTGAFRSLADPLPEGKFIYHHHRAKSGLPTRGGLAFSVATLYLLKSVSVRDWWAYAELYGVPVRIGRYGPNATADDIRTLSEAVAALAADAGAVIPDSMSIDVEAASASGGGATRALFGAQAEWCDQQISKAVVGQTMTTDSGSSRAQAEVHADVRDDLVADDVRQMCETLSQTVVRWYCALNHPERSAGWPRIELPRRPEDLDVESVLKAVDRGLRVPAAWLRGRLGIPEPQRGDEVLVGMSQGAPGGAGPEPNAAAGGPDLHLALAAIDAAAGWGELAEDLVAPLRQALAAADDADAFLAAAAEADVPEAVAADIALQAFGARVDGEVD